MEETENKPINVNAYTKTASVKVIAAFKVLKAIAAAACVVFLVVYAGAINLAVNTIITDLNASAQTDAQAAAAASVLIRILSILMELPIIPILVAIVLFIIEAIGYVNLVNSDHGEKPIRCINSVRMLVLVLIMLAIIVFFGSAIIHLEQKTFSNILPNVLYCILCLIVPFFFYRYRLDIANIMHTIEGERETGTEQYYGGKGLLWKATLFLVIAVCNIIAPALMFLFGGVSTVANMFTEIGNGENALQSIFQAGGSVIVMAVSIAIPVLQLIRAIALRNAAKKFNEMH